MEDQGAWQVVQPDQWQSMRPYMLDCSDLSGAVCQEVRAGYTAALASSIRQFVEHAGRLPQPQEIDLIRSELADYFNANIIPMLAS